MVLIYASKRSYMLNKNNIILKKFKNLFLFRLSFFLGSFSISMCVWYACTHVHACMCVCEIVCVWRLMHMNTEVDVKNHPWFSCSPALLIEAASLNQTQHLLTGLLFIPSLLWESHLPPEAGITNRPPHPPGTYMGSGNLNSCPHSCTSALTTEQ